MDSPAIRLYGRTSGGNDSWARITAGMTEGLRANGALASVYNTAERVSEVDDSLGEGEDAPVGVAVGPIATFSAMMARGNHRERLGLIAANSTWLPSMVRRLDDFVTGLIGPSAWSCEVIRTHCPEMPIWLWQHGVSEAFKPRDDLKPDGPFSALHLSSSNKERKGTDLLIEAWRQCMDTGWLPKDARLNIVQDGMPGVVVEQPGGIRMLGRLNLTETEMAALYQRHHVVVQPSRAEGFGMVPLEAMACGVPAVLTDCTGHAEYVRRTGFYTPGDSFVAIPAGKMEPIDDGPGSLAPSLDADDVAWGISVAYNNLEQLTRSAQASAGDRRDRWNWAATTRRFLDAYRIGVPWNS